MIYFIAIALVNLCVSIKAVFSIFSAVDSANVVFLIIFAVVNLIGAFLSTGSALVYQDAESGIQRKRFGKLGECIGTYFVTIEFLALLGFFVTIKPVPDGYVGVARDSVLQQGLYFASPSTSVKLFSVKKEQLTIPETYLIFRGEPLRIITSDKERVTVELQMSYRFNQEKVVDVCGEFTDRNGEDIIHECVVPALASEVSEVTGKYSADDIKFGSHKELNQSLTRQLNSVFGEKYGVEFSDVVITWVDE